MTTQTGSAAPSYAEIRIAVVDVQRLMSESKAAEDIYKQLTAEREKLQKNIAGHEKDLLTSQQKLSSVYERLSAEELVKKRQEFEIEIAERSEQVEMQRRALDDAQIKAVQELRAKIAEVVAEISAKENYDLVITSQHVVMSKESLDITDAVMAALDKKVSKIKLVIEKS